MDEQQDPGWRTSLLGVPIALLPLIPLQKVRPRQAVVTNLRSIFLAAPLGWLLLLVFLAMMSLGPREAGSPAGGLFGAVIVVGLGGLALIRFVGRAERLKSDGAVRLAASFRAQTLLGLAVASLVILLAFVLFFVAANLAVYLVAMPFGVAGLMLIAPTCGRIHRLDQQLVTMGSTLTLSTAVLLLDSEVPIDAHRSDTA